MTLTLSAPALFILKVLQDAGYEAYIVGGAVRDLLLARDLDTSTASAATTDYDFTTNARPEEIQKLFPEHFYENSFGTVSVTHEHLLDQMQLPAGFVPAPITPHTRPNRIIDLAQATKIHISLQEIPVSNENTNQEVVAKEHHQASPFPSYQITTFRSDEVYDDFRRPSSMNWGNSLQEDQERRDFTINAMALSVPNNIVAQLVHNPQPFYSLEPTQYEVIDRFDGLKDLEAGIIRTVGDAQARFQEDALRMLRAIRFSVQLNMSIADATFASIVANAKLIQNISGERIRDEFLKMLKSAYPAEAVELLDQTQLLDFIMPELQAGKGVMQGGHHTTDVWTHSLDALRTCPAPDPIVRLATLLHDIAKPMTYEEQKGTITFYNHEIIGARVASRIARRLRLSRQDTQRIFTLVRYHMFHYQPTMTDAAVRRFMRNVGLQNIDDILDLREGDRLGSGARKTSWRLEEFKARMIDQLNQPMEIRDLAINGDDLMSEFELKPGPELGRVLKALFEEVLENPDLNTREALLTKARQLLES
jgi:tRNA nucleotidyltransferase (CCA-adding enzyme)